MFGYPAAFANGYLFAGLHQESFILKLSESDRRQLQDEHGAAVFEPRPGRRMREYMVLPAKLLADRVALNRWLARSLAYVVSLSPKETKTRKRRRPSAAAASR